MTHQYTKLADALEAIAQKNSYPSPQPDAVTTMEAARILRAADAVDVGELMAMSDTSIVLACDYLMTHKESAKEKAVEHRAALESSLRLVLAQRVPPGCVAFDEAQERAAFESHLKAELKANWLYNNPNGHELVDLMVSVTPDEVNGHKQTYAGRYVDKGVETQWHGWRARAAAAPQAKEQTA